MFKSIKLKTELNAVHSKLPMVGGGGEGGVGVGEEVANLSG